MKNWLFIGVIMVASSCSADPQYVDFGELRIPQKYVLLAPGDSPKGVFDDEDIDIALVVDEEEVKSAVPRYEIEERGSRELSFVINQKPFDLIAISDSVLSGVVGGMAESVPDKYSSNKRVYRFSDSWVLVSENSNQRQLVAQCMRSGIAGNVEGCTFSKNINGYGVSYHLENQNLSLTQEFEKFIAQKIEAWKVARKAP